MMHQQFAETVDKGLETEENPNALWIPKIGNRRPVYSQVELNRCAVGDGLVRLAFTVRRPITYDRKADEVRNR